VAISVRRVLVVSSGLTIAWLILWLGIGSWLLSEAYEGRGISVLRRAFAAKRELYPLSHYLSKVRFLAFGGGIAISGSGLALAAVLYDARRGAPRARRIVRPATPTSLAGIRIWIGIVALISVLAEDVASFALLPSSLPISPGLGVFAVLRHAPGAEALFASSLALHALKWTTVLALVASIFGLFTRVALPLAFVGALVMGGVLRLHTHFFHTGLLPLYLLGVIMLTPCADAWSLDAWRWKRAGKAVLAPEEPAMAHGWGRFTVWIVIAMSYFAAGTCKIRNGGFGWWDGVNLKCKVLADALCLHTFDLPFVPLLAALPLFAYSFMGIVSLLVEFSMIAVPFSAQARRILPLAAVGMHVGIFLAQEILFIDLILIHLLFFDNRRWALPLAGKVRSWLSSVVPALAAGPEPRTDATTIGSKGRFTGALVLVPVAYITTIVLATEAYPITTWPMYADRQRTTTVEYVVFHGVDAEGRKMPFQLERELGVLRFNRSYDLIPYAFIPDLQPEFHKVLDAFLTLHNAKKPPDRRVVALKFDLREWDYGRAPEDPQYGASAKQFVHHAGDSERSRAEARRDP
jgi:hypothetical protein